MSNRKQTDGQDFCECGHKEFHHNRTAEGNYLCCMKDCDCENYKKRKKK